MVKKILKSLKEHGLCHTLKKSAQKVYHFARRVYYGVKMTLQRFYYFSVRKYRACKQFVKRVAVFIDGQFKRKTYAAEIKAIPVQDRIVLWTQNFDWSVALFQRPQHIARCMAMLGCTFFYYTSQYSDPDVKTIKKIGTNLYLVNRNNMVFLDELKKHLGKVDKPKYLQVYSTNLDLSIEELKEYENNGYHILYEYIDDLAPEISGTKEIPKNILDKFNYATSNNRIPMTVTADLLRNEIIGMRGEENLVFATNGVDVEHFKKIQPDFKFNDKFAKVLARKKKIVGYYGAIAKWFDYELLTYAAKHLPDVDFVLIGAVYDESFAESCMKDVSNIHFIGPVPYQDLPQYANKFDLYTIPFLVNSITNATSPLKLFEYMAMRKPILTTAMQESSKYRSVNVSHDYEEYVEKVKLLLNYTPGKNPEYYEILAQDASNNTWEAKADAIMRMLQKYEEKNNL